LPSGKKRANIAARLANRRSLLTSKEFLIMAKVSGPLMSMDARGKFGNTLVFSGWKGRPTVRQLVTPSNPKTTDQQKSRNAVRAAGAGQHWANLTALILTGAIDTDKANIRDVAPSGQAWNGTLVKAMIGAGDVNYDAASAIWAGLTGGEKTAWDNAAAALVPAIPAVAQTVAGGGLGTPLTDGEVFLHYMYGLYVLGLYTLPDATPPVYA
jgi:hypothetical protein